MRQTLSRLDGIQKFLNYPHSRFLHHLEKELQANYDGLLRREKGFWITNSKISWICEGDVNTKFFHTTTLTRRRRNTITLLEDEARNSFDTHSPIYQHVASFFQSLYTTEHPTSYRIPTTQCGPTPGFDTLDAALRDFKVIKLIKSFKPLNAPGLDGIHHLLYQKFCDITAKHVIDFYKEAFEHACIPPKSNHTLLCLIPKNPEAQILNNVCPIGLYNTIHKVVTKIIANRLKPFLPMLIGHIQASLIANRRPSNHAIVVQEAISHFQKMKGKTGSMAHKIDLEKAFDRIE